MDMDEHKQYSSIAAYQVAEMAKAKGLTLVEGDYEGWPHDPNYKLNVGGRGYGVAKVIAGQYLTLTDDGYVAQDYCYTATARYQSIRFRLTLEEAKKQIESFDGTIKNYPRFFAYIRVYKGEPEYYGSLQRLCLTEFAEKHGITYADKIMCVGGQENVIWHPECSVEIDDVIDCCWKSFSQITEDDYLVVTDFSRLNGELDLWKNSYNIIPVDYEETGYERYDYYESEKLKKAIRYFEKLLEDVEYEAMSREYEEMKLELGLDEQPCIDVEEEEYE